MTKPAANATPIDILYAEDQEADRMFVQQAFLQVKTKINLHFVKDGEEAMAFLQRTGDFAGSLRPDLIFLDINMNGKNGPATLEAIRDDKALSHIPIIMLSGSALARDVESCYVRHANSYVSKPLTFPQMLDFVNAIENFWLLHAVLPQEEKPA